MEPLDRVIALQKLADAGNPLVEMQAAISKSEALDALCEILQIDIGISHAAYAKAREDLSRNLLRNLLTRWGQRHGFKFIDIYSGTRFRPESYLLFRTEHNAVKWCPRGIWDLEQVALLFSLYWRCSAES